MKPIMLLIKRLYDYQSFFLCVRINKLTRYLVIAGKQDAPPGS